MLTLTWHGAAFLLRSWRISDCQLIIILIFIFFFECSFDFSLVCWGFWIHAVMWHCRHCRLLSRVGFRCLVCGVVMLIIIVALVVCLFVFINYLLIIEISNSLSCCVGYAIGCPSNIAFQDIISIRRQNTDFFQTKDWKTKPNLHINGCGHCHLDNLLNPPTAWIRNINSDPNLNNYMVNIQAA